MKVSPALLALAALFAAAEACKCMRGGRWGENIVPQTKYCCSEAAEGQWDPSDNDCVHSTMKHQTHFDTCCRQVRKVGSDCGHTDLLDPWRGLAVDEGAESDDSQGKDEAGSAQDSASADSENKPLASRHFARRQL